MEFNELRMDAGLLHDDVAELLGVSLSTVKRWCKAGVAPKYATDRLLMISGRHPDWYGLHIRDGEITTRTNFIVTARDIENIEYQRQLLRNTLELTNRMSVKLTKYRDISTSVNDDKTDNIYQFVLFDA